MSGTARQGGEFAKRRRRPLPQCVILGEQYLCAYATLPRGSAMPLGTFSVDYALEDISRVANPLTAPGCRRF